MKTLASLFLCLILGISHSNMNAQPIPVPGNDRGTGAVTAIYTFPFWLPEIEGVASLEGTVQWHVVFQYKNGNLLGVIINIKEEHIENPLTGEIFKCSENDKQDLTGMTTIWHTNLVGNMGTHYILAITFDWETGIYTVDKIRFPGNGQN